MQHLKGCVLEDFKLLNSFDENFDLSNLKQSYAPGDTVRVRCKVGYRGFFKLVCTDERWEPVGEKCRAISCGHPGDVQFADFRLVKGTDYVFGSQVQYTCHKGYQMTSYTSTRNCLEQGWDGHLPECESISCPSLSVDNNVLVNGDWDQATSGSVLQFSCSSRDDVLIGPAQIICDDNGRWDNNPPKCKEISCEKPVSDRFTVPERKMVYKKDEVLRYTCNPTYRKVDGRLPLCKKVGQSAQWTPMPQCELITCKLSANPPEGTTYNPRNQMIFKPGQTVSVSCGETQWVKSTEFQSAELTCLNDGEWDYQPVCQTVTCFKRAENVYRFERTYYNSVNIGQTLWYQCQSEYEATSSSATCTRQGWEPKPLCKERRCPKPSHKNAEITDHYQKDKYNHNERINFKCIYDTRVTFYADCYYGNWRGYIQTCREKPCVTQPHIEHGVMLDEKRNMYEHGEGIWFRCEDETDNFRVTCQSGEWKKPKSCKDTACTKQPNIRNGRMESPEKLRYNHKETVVIKCTTGSMDRFSISCQSGEWIAELQCPEQSACGSTLIPNGFSHEHEDTLYYTCNKGFKLLNKGWWGAASCVEGKWNTSECVDETNCGPVPDIPNLNVISENPKFSEGETFPIQCDTGYQNLHIDLQVLTCVKGKWTFNNVTLRDIKVPLKDICTPIAKKCIPPPKIANAVIMAPFEKEYSSNTTLTYHCRDNLIMDGDATIQCNNGIWQRKNISCKEAPKSVEEDTE